MAMNTPPRETIGIIGLGAMGAPLALRLLRAGYEVAAHDLRPDAAADLDIHRAGSGREVGDLATTVIGCLPTADSYRDAVFGSDGLAHGRVVTRYVHVGTTGADLVRELGARLGPRIVTVDAPITGGVPRALRGELTVIAAGDAAVLAALAPVFASYGNKTVQVSERIGDAQTVKLINNVLSAANLAMACEALNFGTRAGIAAEKILEAVNAGTGQSDASLTKVPRYVVTRRFDYGGSMRISLKDLGQYHTETVRVGAAHGIATAVRDAYFAAADHGHRGGDMTEIALYFEEISGTAADTPSPPRGE